MGIGVLVLGESGSGKTTAAKNLDKMKTIICQVEKQRLPFREVFPNTLKRATYPSIVGAFKEGKFKEVKTVDAGEGHENYPGGMFYLPGE